MIQIRKESTLKDDLTFGNFSTIKSNNPEIISYSRGDNARIYINLSSNNISINLPKGKVMLNNYSNNITNKLQPYQAILIEVKNND